jgi:hypothetical protein
MTYPTHLTSAALAALSAFWDLPITANEAVVTGHRTPLGYQQILDAALGSAVGLTMPTQSATNVPGGWAAQIPVGYAIIQNSGTAAVRWRDDGTAPTATIGMLLAAGAELDYVGDISKIQFIHVAAGAQLEVSLYL